MDLKKEEAMKCLKMAREAIEYCDRVRAQQFITNAQQLDPSLSSTDILSKLNGQIAESSTKPLHAQPRVRVSNPSDGQARVRVSETCSYTEEQITLVREINNKKNYYDVLDVEESCTVEDIRKAYRKLSLKVHPDKNKAPGADMAFSALSKAFKCLSNEETRKRYKLTGYNKEAFERRAAPRHGAHGGGFHGSFEGGAFNPWEIFRNLLFGGMNPRGLILPVPVVKKMILFAPIWFLIWTFMPVREPIFLVSPNHPYHYQYKFTTQKGTDYYVKSMSFEQDYPPNSPHRVKLEVEVEKEYVSTCKYFCEMELQFFQEGRT